MAQLPMQPAPDHISPKNLKLRTKLATMVTRTVKDRTEIEGRAGTTRVNA